MARERQRQVIKQMVAAGFIDEKGAEIIEGQEIKIADPRIKIAAPHFVFFVKDYLQERLGVENIGRQGLTVRTTLDYGEQVGAEAVVREEVEKVGRMKITNGAALVVGVKRGEVLAMVGSKDYFATDIDGKFNVTTALRQPGSAIKPINYLLALRSGKTLVDLIDDAPVTYNVKGQKPYTPQN